MKEKLMPRVCPLCTARGNRAFEPVGQGCFAAMEREYRVARCRSCGLIQQNPTWSPAFYNGLYAHHVYDLTGQKLFPEQVERYRAVGESIQQSLLAARGSFDGAQFLDFGSYDGSFVSWLQRFTDWGKRVAFYGYDITLMDIPKGARFFNSLAALARTGKRFDVVTLNHVLEHLLQPVATLADIRKRFLRSGGSVIIEVPDISYVRRGDFSPFHIQHVNYFTPQTLTRACNSAGLAVDAVRTFQNHDCGRDPLYPTVLVVARAADGALFDGAALRRAVADSRKRLSSALAKLPAGSTLAVVGCGDPLYPTVLVVARAADGALFDGVALRRAVAESRKRLSSALAKLPSGSTLAVVGCGDPLSQLLPLIPRKVHLVGLFDNSKDLHGKELLGHSVRSVEDIIGSRVDMVLTSTANERNGLMIEAQLRHLGFTGTIIRSFEIA